MASASDTYEADRHFWGRAKMSGARYPLGVCAVVQRDPGLLFVLLRHHVAIHPLLAVVGVETFEVDMTPCENTDPGELISVCMQSSWKMAAGDGSYLGDPWAT